MPHFRNITGKSPGLNDYWKIPTQTQLTGKEMREELDRRGLTFSTRVKTDKLRNALQRSDRGLQVYDQKSDARLRKLLDRRDVAYAVGDGREVLIDLLQQYDDSREFHRFQELPAELRNAIYEYHFAEFNEPISAPVQPPITRTSRKIREETLGLFYQSCTFKFGMIGPKTRPVVHTSPRLTFPSDVLHFIRHTPAVHLSGIRNFRLSFSGFATSFEYSPPLDIDISISKEGSKYKFESSRLWDHKSPRNPQIKLEVEKVVKQIAAREGEDRLTVDDIFDLRRAWEIGLSD